MNTGFFKVKPLNISGHKLKEKAGFLWVDDPDEQKLSYIAFSLDHTYYDGCELLQCDKNDPEFKEYVQKDLLQVEKDLEKLLLLKNRLLSSL